MTATRLPSANTAMSAMKQKKAAAWVDVKVRLNSLDRTGLLSVVRDLYDASDLTRRFLHARFAPTEVGLDRYRRKVRECRLSEPVQSASDSASRCGAYHQRIPAGHWGSGRHGRSPSRIGEYQGVIGWGYGDFLGDIAKTIQRRRNRVVKKPNRGDRRANTNDAASGRLQVESAIVIGL